MDTHRRLTATEADKALRGLFRTSGHAEAPVGIDARILQRIALAPRPLAQPERALLPKWVWGAMIAGLIGLTIFLLSSSTGAEPSVLSKYFSSLPSFSFAGIFSSPWLWMGCGSLMMLLGLEVVLERRRLMVHRGH
ncbi:MAG: hypothetical protein WAU70_08595 [Flavobacteriales bacterium]